MKNILIALIAVFSINAYATDIPDLASAWNSLTVEQQEAQIEASVGELASGAEWDAAYAEVQAAADYSDAQVALDTVQAALNDVDSDTFQILRDNDYLNGYEQWILENMHRDPATDPAFAQELIDRGLDAESVSAFVEHLPEGGFND